MDTPNQIQLTQKDKERYKKEIEALKIQNKRLKDDNSIRI